ncbi:NAD(P)-dependent oxidoreductase [Microbacterium sp. F51-2R]|uniref:NAD(P)-dependent oxidoreductase n=1 Tax=Microbacterium sp. F51-2R TaxID=3445777 RepID=UPI003F9F25D6
MSGRISIAWLGLGNMGGPMSRRLAAAGHDVTGFDPVPAARDQLLAAGGTVTEDASGAVSGADVVVLMLPSSAVVESVLEGDGVLEAVEPGALLIDMGSSEPLRTRRIAQLVTDNGARFLDAPVSGGVAGATGGTLTIMAGGPDDDYVRALPVFELLGRPTHVGPVGAGHALKALNNLMSAIHLWGSSEAIDAGVRFGLDPAVMLEVINGSSGRSGSTQQKWPKFILPGSFDSGFGLRLMLKDMKIAAGLERAVGTPHVLSDAAIGLWELAAAELPPTADHTEVARWIADHAETPTETSREES